MRAKRLTEGTVSTVMTYIKNNIAQALSDTRVDRIAAGDNNAPVSLETPNSFFIYPKARGYRPPAIFVIAPDFDLKKQERNANFISGQVRVNVSVLVEDKDRERLQVKSWRFQSALFEMLDQQPLTSGDSKIKLVVVVKHIRETALYTDAKDEESPDAIFRKESVLECDVEHYENF